MATKWKDRNKVKKWKDRERANLKEAHPIFSGLEGTLKRWGVKNFGGHTSEDFLKAINTKYPDLDAKIESGQVVIKDNNDGVYKALDPQGGGVTEFIKDAGDIAYEVPAMIGEGAATIGGGLAGFLSPVPGGTVMGAMGGGAAGGAATEGLRQALGAALGYRDEVDGEALAANAIASGVSPLVFGVGAPGVKTATKLGLNSAKRAAFNNAGKGVVSRLGGAGNKMLANALTGVPIEAIETYSKKMGLIDNMDDVAKLNLLEKTSEGAIDAVERNRKNIGAKIGNVYEEILQDGAQRAPLKEVKRPVLLDLVQKRKSARRTSNPNIVDSYQRALAEYRNSFKGMDKASGPELLSFKDALKDNARIYKTVGKKFKDSDAIQDKTLANAYTQAYGAFNDSVDSLAGGKLKPLNKSYAKTLEDRDFITKTLKNEEASDRLLRNLGKKSKDVARQKISNFDKKYGTNISDKAQLLSAREFFHNPELSPISLNGTTSTTRSILGQVLATGAGALTFADSRNDFDGMAKGAALGGLITSPKALKYLLKAKSGINKSLDKNLSKGVQRNLWGDILEKTYE